MSPSDERPVRRKPQLQPQHDGHEEESAASSASGPQLRQRRGEGAKMAPSLLMSHVWVWTAYLIAAGVGIGYGVLITQTAGGSKAVDPVFVAAVADVLATVVIFCFSFAFNNSSFYDAYWSIFPMVAAVYWAAVSDAHDQHVPGFRRGVAVAVVWAWGLRLTINWIAGWTGLDHEDWRYVKFREDIGKGDPNRAWLYWLQGSFLSIHVAPTVLVFLACVPAYVALYQPRDGGHGASDTVAVVTTALGGATCLGATFMSWLADRQMRQWRATNPPRDAYIDQGLWRYSRHPNYFGEMMFWWGLYVIALGVDAGRFCWSGVGALLITAMFFGASIPLMEERSLNKRPSYATCQRTTSMLIPWFRRSEESRPLKQ